MTQSFFDFVLAPFYWGFNGLNLDGNYLQFSVMILLIFGAIRWLWSLIID